MQALVRAVQFLGYVPAEEAKYFQWKRTLVVQGVPHEVKLDALVGPLGEQRKKLQVNSPRVRPKGKSIGFHAHQNDEALFLEENPIEIRLQGTRSNAEAYSGSVFVPEAYPYMLMKLSAFADRIGDENKDLGRHHALDAYTIVGMMTEPEYERAKLLSERSRTDPSFIRVCQVVSDYFENRTSLGMLRLQEHRLTRADFRFEEFISVLRDIFPAR